MMLKRIHRIKGIGLLHDVDGRSHSFEKVSLIYADNGVGKSTLASVFRSCSTGNSDLINCRKTVDGNNPPEVELQFCNGQRSKYSGSSWDAPFPNLTVFDADFVEQNVYAGGRVTTDQRKSLLSFALGEGAVSAQREYNQANDNALVAAHEVRDLTQQLAAQHDDMSLIEFRALNKVADAGSEISRINEKIVETENVELINSKNTPKIIEEPVFDVDLIFSILARSLDDIDLSAEKRVREHIELREKIGLERWISDGHSYEDGEKCPYCSQSLEGVDLVQAYRSYFSASYAQLKKSVAGLRALIVNLTSETVAERLQAGFATASATIDGWQEHVRIPALNYDDTTTRTILTEIRCSLDTLRNAKEAQLLENFGSENEKADLKTKWQMIARIVQLSNKKIVDAAALIDGYKKQLANADTIALRNEIKRLELTKVRHRQDVVELFSQLDSAAAREVDAKKKKRIKKNALNTEMRVTLECYKKKINELLERFGAQFSIPSIDFNYHGGLRSDYTLQMRGSNIALSGGVPDFKTSLSEGDKRTLAFAFFIASVESDSNLSRKVVVIDDPMCSLDYNRKQQTRAVLRRIHCNCAQLIVLVHDIHFMRDLRTDIARETPPHDISCIKLRSVANRYTDFDCIDVDKECEGAYFKCHRVLGEYLNGTAQSSMEVARSIRPMLEGYLHRRFPGFIDSGLLFGQAIGKIDSVSQDSPLIHAKNITKELNEINSYAGRYHHDTNPAVDQVQITESELRSFVERALKLVHSGAA